MGVFLRNCEHAIKMYDLGELPSPRDREPFTLLTSGALATYTMIPVPKALCGGLGLSRLLARVEVLQMCQLHDRCRQVFTTHRRYGAGAPLRHLLGMRCVSGRIVFSTGESEFRNSLQTYRPRANFNHGLASADQRGPTV